MSQSQSNAAAHQRFTELFSACYGAVLGYATRRVGPSRADDVVAETFTVAWRHLDNVPLEPLPWLYRVAAGSISNQRRGAVRRERLTHRVSAESSAAGRVADHSDAVVENMRLAAAFDRLSEPDREILRLVAWEGLDPHEGAIVVGCTPDAFKVRVHRARRRLLRKLDLPVEPTSHFTVPTLSAREQFDG